MSQNTTNIPKWDGPPLPAGLPPLPPFPPPPGFMPPFLPGLKGPPMFPPFPPLPPGVPNLSNPPPWNPTSLPLPGAPHSLPLLPLDSVSVPGTLLQSQVSAKEGDSATSHQSSSSGTTSTLGWEEYRTESGQPYWYHKEKDISVWEKPEELKSDMEKEEKTTWREYVTPSGQKYYHNIKTEATQWEVPQEYKEYLDRMDELRRKAAEAMETPIEKLLKSVFTDDPLKNAYARCLVDKSMKSHWNWEQAASATFEDERSKALKMADRKSVFHLMTNKLRAYEEDERYRKKRAMEDSFWKLLADWKEYDKYTTFREFAEKFAESPSFLAFPSERDRHRLFIEYRETKEREIQEESRNRLKTLIRNFENILSHTSFVTAKTSWSEFREMFKLGDDYSKYDDHNTVITHDEKMDTDHSNPKSSKNSALQQAYYALEPLDRLQTYVEYVRSLMKIESDRLSTERFELKESARKAREGFRALLSEKIQNGTINVNSRWGNFWPSIASDPRYLELARSPIGSTPAELFYDAVHEIESKYLKEKHRIKSVAKASKLRILKIGPNGTSQIPSNIHSLSIEDVPKMDLHTWLSSIKSHLGPSSVEDSILTEFYDTYSRRELSKLKNRVERSERHFAEDLEETLERLVKKQGPSVLQNIPTKWADVEALLDLPSSSSEFLTPELKNLVYSTMLSHIKSQHTSLTSNTAISTNLDSAQKEQMELEEGELIDTVPLPKALQQAKTESVKERSSLKSKGAHDDSSSSSESESERESVEVGPRASSALRRSHLEREQPESSTRRSPIYRYDDYDDLEGPTRRKMGKHYETS